MFKTVTEQSDAAPPKPNPDGPAIELFNHELTDEYDSRLVLLHSPESPRAAAFRVLRHKVVTAGKPRTILVSSPGVGEAKTLCAINLALALAEAGRSKVLLLEANLRSPQLAHAFGFTPPWCFAAQLAAHREQPLVPWRLVEVSPSGLHVGALDPMVEHTRIFDATAFSIAMERFRNDQYEHVVIDGPPVLDSAEVNLMQDSCDCVLFTGMAGKASARALRQSAEQLAPTTILGLAMIEGSPKG
jgi:Mrp family chromosome partitioning ATPase